jgi:phytoene dehydrogenase-like protein
MERQGDIYDVIVLGSGLAGLIAATYLSKAHRRVLLLKEKRYPLSCQENGYRFVPFTNFSEKLIKRSLLKRVSKELGLPFVTDLGVGREVETKLRKLKEKPAFQVILPKARIDLFCQRSMLQRELKREFPREITQIEDFYKEMDEIHHLLNREKAQEVPESVFPIQSRSWIKRWWPFKGLPKGRMDERLAPFSREFREFTQLQLMSWSNLYSGRLPISLANYLLIQEETDECFLEIDLERLEEKIFEKFFQHGGRIEEVEGIEKMGRGWRRGVTLTLKGDGRVFGSKLLILNFPLHRFSNFLGHKVRLLSKWANKIQTRYMILPLFLGIREKVVPVGMRNLLVSILDLNKPYEGGNLLFLSLSQKGDEREAPEGRRAVTVESLVSPNEWGPDLLAEHQKGVMRHLFHLFPFLEEHIEFSDWDWAKEQFSCWSYPHFLYETVLDFQWREGIVPHQLSGNFYLAGKENLPYLGTEGEVLSGLIAAKKILERYS